MSTETKQSSHTPGPWKAENRVGAGWQVRGILPAGFEFDASYREADGTTSFQLWGMASPQMILVACERWVQFETAQWAAMQEANARLIAAAPDLLSVLKRWVDCFDELDRLSDPDDPITIARHDYHGARIEDSRAAIAKAEGRE